MPVLRLAETPSQTAGPFVHLGLLPGFCGLDATTGAAPHILRGQGTPVRIGGGLFDGSGAPVTDAVLELWQADSEGRYATPEFGGWGRTATDPATGEWHFETIMPGRARRRDGRLEAPHVNLLIFSRGINVHLHTRVYFADEAAANGEDPLLAAVGAAQLRETLIARRTDEGPPVAYRHDIHLQGDRETVFLDI